MEETKQKLTMEQMLATFVGGLAFTATCGVSYIITYYYAMYQEATGFTDGQIGTILSVTGVVGVISYLFGGPLADKFRPKVLLIFCCLSTAVCALLMITFPPYNLMLILQGVLALCALLPHWSPLCKFLNGIGRNADESNKVWGIYTAVVGASGALIGFICTAILNYNTARMGMRITVLLYVALEVICAIMLNVVDKSKPGEKGESTNTFKFSYIITLLTMPKMWMVYISVTCLYLTGTLGFTYLMPMLSNVFLVPLATVTLISTIRANLIKVVAGPAAGTMAAKLHTSHKGQAVLYVVAFLGMGLLLIIPWGPGSVALALVSVIILALAYAASTTYWNPMVADAGIPKEYLGTAAGFLAVVQTIPDTFMYKIAGNAIEKNGVSAYKTIFMVIMVAYVIGFIVNFILIKTREKEKVAESQTA